MPEIFTYDLPPDRIAQRPVHPYDSARLLVVDKTSGSLQSTNFSGILPFLRAGDLLVFNNTRVIPARLFGRLPAGGEAEILLHRKIEGNTWRCLGRPLKKFRPGTEIEISKELIARAGKRFSDWEVVLEFESRTPGKSADSLLAALGTMPIPPYIRGGRADAVDRDDYQTFFAEHEGSVAAPTASLHFTPELTEKIRAAGVQIRYLTLHVGSASFLALSEGSDGSLIPPGSERFLPDPELVTCAREVKAAGGRVIAVGTTAVRALESMADAEKGDGFSETELFITPGYQFKLVDAMVTNFHQSGTTHLLLVEAFIGRDLLARSYAEALSTGFRFLSYGDGMFLYR